MSFYDFDGGKAGSGLEYAALGGFDRYQLSESTQIVTSTESDGRTKFTATESGNGADKQQLNAVNSGLISDSQGSRDRSATTASTASATTTHTQLMAEVSDWRTQGAQQTALMKMT